MKRNCYHLQTSRWKWPNDYANQEKCEKMEEKDSARNYLRKRSWWKEQGAQWLHTILMTSGQTSYYIRKTICCVPKIFHYHCLARPMGPLSKNTPALQESWLQGDLQKLPHQMQTLALHQSNFHTFYVTKQDILRIKKKKQSWPRTTLYLLLHNVSKIQHILKSVKIELGFFSLLLRRMF